jgi:hypothetical protein
MYHCGRLVVFHHNRTNFVSSCPRATAPVARSVALPRTVVFAGDDDSRPAVERGVSVDQDGKSNVWAIEPKMEVSTKSSEETTQTALIAGGGLAVFAVIAGIALTNLPDPNQF